MELITLSLGSPSPFSFYTGVLMREYVPPQLPFAVCHPSLSMRILGHLHRSIFTFHHAGFYCFYCRPRICFRFSISGLIHSILIYIAASSMTGRTTVAAVPPIL